ncbi:MAG: manganese efflux pump [Desulfamplus sp.]|nr:manganese efflux pump [Desulfamplus sp.]
MDFITIFLIAIALAMDAFAVAVTAGFQIRQLNIRHFFRLSWHFGLFQAIMPVIGWYSGLTVMKLIDKYDHWIAFILLLWVGFGMIKGAFADEEDKIFIDPTRGRRLVMLSVATSIDALAVGFSLAALKVSIVLPVIVIGIVALTFTCIGLVVGNRFSSSTRTGERAEIIGGVVLICIGIKILYEHQVFNLFF